MSITAKLISHNGGEAGGDVMVVNAARVSMDKEITQLQDKDINLIKWLAANGHMSPFRHVNFTLRLSAPEFVARQAFKHNVGIAATSGPLPNCADAWNEVSMRYVRMHDCYMPEEWRKAPEEIRQGSSLTSHFTEEEQKQCQAVYGQALEVCQGAYETLLKQGVAREMARMILPLSVETKWVWTLSLQALVHFLKLRLEGSAQQEIQELGQQIKACVEHLCPVSFQALMESPHV